MTRRAYTCAVCGEDCLSDWDDEEAIAEYEHDFGESFDRTKVDEICDDCYQWMQRVLS